MVVRQGGFSLKYSAQSRLYWEIIFHVGKKHRNVHNLIPAAAGIFKNKFYVAKHAVALSLNIIGYYLIVFVKFNAGIFAAALAGQHRSGKAGYPPSGRADIIQPVRGFWRVYFWWIGHKVYFGIVVFYNHWPNLGLSYKNSSFAAAESVILVLWTFSNSTPIVWLRGLLYLQQWRSSYYWPLARNRTLPWIIKKNNDRLKYIFWNSFSCGFCEWPCWLARETGATIVFGPNAHTGYQSHVARMGAFKIGELSIKVLFAMSRVPICWAMQKETALHFTGDTLFIGDVGRPDLAIKSDLTQKIWPECFMTASAPRSCPARPSGVYRRTEQVGLRQNMSKETFDTRAIKTN